MVKHARATRVEVTLCPRAGMLELVVQDNGVGFDPTEHYPGHLGLLSMRERAGRLGGVLTITSSPGGGAQVELRVPVPASGLRSG